jgi:hypothetical protein
MNGNYRISTAFLLIFLTPLSAVALVPPGFEIEAYVRDRVFRLTDPVGCVAPAPKKSASEVGVMMINQCATRVEAVVCGEGAVGDRGCEADLNRILFEGQALFVGRGIHLYREDYSSPRVTSSVACPVDDSIDDHNLYVGSYYTFFSVEKHAGKLTAKCMTPYPGEPPKAKVKTVVWPLYRQYKTTIRIYDDGNGNSLNAPPAGSHTQSTPRSRDLPKELPSADRMDDRRRALDRNETIRVPDWK